MGTVTNVAVRESFAFYPERRALHERGPTAVHHQSPVWVRSDARSTHGAPDGTYNLTSGVSVRVTSCGDIYSTCYRPDWGSRRVPRLLEECYLSSRILCGFDFIMSRTREDSVAQYHSRKPSRAAANGQKYSNRRPPPPVPADSRRDCRNGTSLPWCDRRRDRTCRPGDTSRMFRKCPLHLESSHCTFRCQSETECKVRGAMLYERGRGQEIRVMERSAELLTITLCVSYSTRHADGKGGEPRRYSIFAEWNEGGQGKLKDEPFLCWKR